jgi:putative colanic acid biosynthesis acetyltransferase WcaF
MSTLSDQSVHAHTLCSEADLIDLSSPDNSELIRGASIWIEALWYFLGLPIIRSHLNPSSALRCVILRVFGARIGKGVYIKPGLRVKFPWYLSVGDHSWLGEDVWIDNLAMVTIEAHCCLSQGVYLCTGNHDWASVNMRLFRRPITCHRGCWIGAKVTLCPGVIVGSGAIVTVGSVVTKNVPAMEIHSGVPAQYVKRRNIRPTCAESS